VIAAGIVPAAIEMMDARITRAVEDFVHAGFPIDAAAVLLIEVDGLADGVAADVATIDGLARAHGARQVQVAADGAQRAQWWKGRKSAFGAVARVKPNYYLHDTVVPRTRLVEMLREVYAIAERHDLLVMNVFHAGDGNLHPLLVYDAREPGVAERVEAAGDEIVQASLDAGGVLSGEHGIGLEKQGFMDRLFGPNDLDAQDRLRHAFDPGRRANPDKVLPAGSRCRELADLPEGVWV
jgi:glycolate oxidase